MTKEEFILELKKININIDDKTYEKLEKYYEMLIEYNNHTNLTRITNKEEVYLKHFYDSLTLYKAIKLDSQKVLDIGTGAGFPGLVLKIVFPNLNVTLVDSLNKRIKFLNLVIKELELKKINVLHSRAEDFAKENRELYDIVTSRAVAKLNILLEYCIPCIKEKGLFIPMKSEIENELINATNALKILDCKILKIINFNLPKEESVRNLIIIEKQSKTNIKYPRKFGEIKKKPL